MHLQLMAELTDHDEDLLGILPRGHMKTTIVSKAYVLWSVLTELLHFVALFSNTDAQATAILADISRNFRQNPRILAVYGDVLAPKVSVQLPDGTTSKEEREVKDNDHELITNTGISIRVAGSGTETRGWNFGPYRPELIVGDDIESRDTVTTQAQRDKMELWWDADVQPMRDLRTSRIIIIGTVLHIDSVLARKRRKGSYRVFFRRAVINEPTRKDLWDEWARIWNEDGGREAAAAFYAKNDRTMLEGAEVLWPAGLSYLKLAEKRKDVGPFAFQTEYQNEPVASGSVIIKPEWVADRPRYIDGSAPYILDKGQSIPLSDLRTFQSADVAISKKDDADFFVLATGGKHPDGRIYIWDILRAHLSAPEQIATLIRQFQRWKPVRVAIESVAYQRALKDMVDEASARMGLYVPTHAVIPDTDKIRRLVRWQPQHEQRLIRYCDSVPEQCITELTQFPLAEHDDVPDAISQLLDEIADVGMNEAYSPFTFNG